MDIFLLRHAETKSNQEGVLSCGVDDSLTARGYEQSQLIAPKLQALGVEAIFSSPYPRALQTITPFSQISGLQVQVFPCLAEGQLVLEPDLRLEEPRYQLESGYPIRFETKEQFLGRAVEASKMLRSQSLSRVLVVSHGHMIRELINIFVQSLVKVRFPHDNCGLSHICLANSVTVKYLNRELSSEKDRI